MSAHESPAAWPVRKSIAWTAPKWAQKSACDRERLTRSVVVCQHCHTTGYYGDPCPNGCDTEPLGGERVIA